MIGKRPSVWFTSAVAVLCICVLALEAFVGVDEEIVLLAVLTVLFSTLVVIVRTVLMLRPSPREAEVHTLRAWVPAVLMAATFLVLGLFRPSELRSALSEDSLDARTSGWRTPGRATEKMIIVRPSSGSFGREPVAFGGDGVVNRR